MISIILAVGGLALLDSLNPFSISAMAVVIAKSQSLTRGLVFIGGTFLAYFLGGVVLLNGWVAALEALLPFITSRIASIGWGVCGLATIGGAIYLWMKAGRSSDKSNSNTKPAAPAVLLGIFVFSLVSTASDLPTAIPLFGAIPLIVETKPSVLGIIAWLIFYCLVYISPLFLILALKLIGGDRLEPILLTVNKVMDWIIGRLTPLLLIILGLWCFSNINFN
jgi:cytochrome c biogenesis protein CcdA